MAHACCRWLILKKNFSYFWLKYTFLLPTDSVQSYEKYFIKIYYLCFLCFFLIDDSKVIKGNKRSKQSPPGGEAKILLFA